MPIVVMKEGVKESSLNRSKQHDFPTPESPMRSNFICEHNGQLDGEMEARLSGLQLARDAY